MRKSLVILTLGASLASPLPANARPFGQAPLKLERVVMLMRHGIRPPTKAAVVPPGYTTQRWPSWPVDFGLLTPRGAAGVKLLGAADRMWLAKRGLMAEGCPAPGIVDLKASSKQRAIRTAESWAEGFMPGCAIEVQHPGEGDPDPIFHGLDDRPALFDGARAYREALALAPAEGPSAEGKVYAAEIALLAKVLGCTAPACPLLNQPTTLVASEHDRAELEGPADVGSTASQTLLLEYLEGMAMKDVGWGRVTRAQIERLLRFHPLKFKYSNRVDYVARAAGAPLADAVVQALTRPGPNAVTLLGGHDTNIADLGGFFQLHWRVPSYPVDDVPPGAALGFELLHDRSGTQFVRAFFRAQTMDQLRYQQDLTTGDGPFRQFLAIPGCGNSVRETACPLSRFQQLVKDQAIRLP